MNPNLSDQEKARLYDEMQSRGKGKGEASTLEEMRAHTPKKSSWAVYIVVPVVVGLFGLLVYNIPRDDQPPSARPAYESNTNKILAYHQAERYVKKHLKSPSTAAFPKVSEFINHITGTDEQYKIVSWVDSQNGFGAMIRTKWSCVVKINGDMVRCEQIEFYE